MKLRELLARFLRNLASYGSCPDKSDYFDKASRNPYEENARNKSAFNGVPSGFMALDRVTMGWQPSDLIIIPAPPRMRKPAFALSMTRNITIDYNKPVGYFSLEMSAQQLKMRLLAAESGLNFRNLYNGQLTPDQRKHLETSPLTNAPLFIDDTPALSITELRSKVEKLKTQHDIQLIVIDYLQLMNLGCHDNKRNREQEVAAILCSLKAVAKEFDLPIIVLSMVSRSCSSANKRPQLSDLRESGNIEQDADIVIFLHHPTSGSDRSIPSYDTDTRGAIEAREGYQYIVVRVAKQRQGENGSFGVEFDAPHMTYTCIAR